MAEETGERPRIRVTRRNSEQVVKLPRFVRNIEAITEYGRVSTREDLEKVVESPLLAAAQYLYDLNVETIDSSANRKDALGSHIARINIDFDSLSPENQQIAIDLLGEPHRGRETGTPELPVGREITVEIPINENSTEQEVSNRALEIARKFKKQTMTWAQTRTPDEVKGIEDHFYFDQESGKYYLSREQYLKANPKQIRVQSTNSA